MANEVERIVQSRYGAVAQSGLSSDRDDVRDVAVAFGYSEAELGSIPADANMGLSCGNPIASASLKPGEVVVDLGSGGGLDVFLAAQRVGPTGRAIGIDMTKEMIDLAKRNALKAGQGMPPANVEFHLATIDDLPLPDGVADCVISNCVINLAPDKRSVFREMARVLKPGGRVAISDIALKKSLPPEIGQDLLAYVGCIAGAIPIDVYKQGLLDAGFSAVQIVDTGADLNVYAKIDKQAGCCSSTASRDLPVASDCCTPSVHNQLADLLSRYNINEFAASVKVYAVKPQ
ncbi:MAG TPA: arsenite methyltransferase [Planctomycetaceae bacterium]|jgi:SAM-dependent methyltransferase|nr:arsenite methyltransferase [Planctomycetaceae bacterium]